MSWRRPFPPERLLAVGILLLMFGLALFSLKVKSPTFDEQGFLVRGLGYLRGENRHMRVGHPLGLNALNSFLLVADDRVGLPTSDPYWQKTSFHRPAEIFLWEMGNDVELIMFLARLPTLWLGLLLAALSGRWAAQLSHKRWAGLVALAFVALDPNLLAHGRLVTTDFGLTAATLLATYAVWRALTRLSWWRILLAGAAFGLLQNTKFTAGLFVPFLALLMMLAFWLRWRRRAAPGRLLWQLLLLYPAAAIFTLWASYGFQVGALPANDVAPGLAGLTLPLSHHLDQLLDIFARAQTGADAFLLGDYSPTGWWYYFPVTFMLKTPLPSLLLLLLGAVGAVQTLRRRLLTDVQGLGWAALLLPSLGYFVIALTTKVNLGYRHLLPILPLLLVFATSQASTMLAVSNPAWRHRTRAGGGVLAGWLLLNTLWLAPDFLAFFNGLAGGPDNGWRRLADSNIDWGQDLGQLAAWQQAEAAGPLWLSYFGEARPDYYGLDYLGLPSFPPRLTDPTAQLFNPADPAPGFYAISATNLQGVLFTDHDLLAWFRQREPVTKIGYSIFIYKVEPYGEPAGLALGSAQLDELDPALLAELGTNDIAPRWFDGAVALQLPAGARSFVYLPAGNHPFASVLIELGATADGPLWLLPGDWPDRAQKLFVGPDNMPVLFRQADGAMALLAHKLENETISAGTVLRWQSIWQQMGDARSLKQFIHLRDGENMIVAQWDGFGAHWRGWLREDWLWQKHMLVLPVELPAGNYTLYTGLYDPATASRWLVADRDELQLGTITIVDAEAAP